MRFPFSLIPGAVIHRLLHEDLACSIEVVRTAYLAHAEGRTVNLIQIPEK